MRGGPDKDHDVSFIFTRVGWPVEITAEFENWRRIRDSDGSDGWVYHSLLSGKRMAAVQMKEKTDLAALHADPDANSPVMAKLEVGVLGTVKTCTGSWCHLVGERFRRLGRAERPVGRLPQREDRMILLSSPAKAGDPVFAWRQVAGLIR